MHMSRAVLGMAFVGGAWLLASCVGSEAVPTNVATGDGGTPSGVDGGTQSGADGASSADGGGDGSANCGTVEKCGNKIDDNCDGKVDEGCDCDGVQEGTDRACGQDGPGICTLGKQTCKGGDWTACSGIAPHAAEDACDGQDENCNGQVDEGLTITCLHDIDKDGYPNPTDKKEVCPDPAAAGAPRFGCPVDYIRQAQSPGSDCNDSDPSIKPSALQLCDKTDWDCDGKLRNGCPGGVTLGASTNGGIFGITVTTSGCGTQAYGTSTTSCPGGGAVGIGGFSGFPSGTFTSPTQFRLSCNGGLISETQAAPEYTYALAQNGATNPSDLTGVARGDQTAGSAACDAGQWLVGIKVTRSCLLDRVSAICAPITYERSGVTGPWSAKTGVKTTKVALGNPNSLHPETTLECAPGSVMTSLTEWHTTGSAGDSNYASAIQIGCSPLGFTPQ